MLNKLIKFSLKNKYFVLFCSLAIVIIGVQTARNMDVDVFPDLTAPTVVVMTDAHGMASEEVERLVTYPIETAVNGATDVRRVRSSSSRATERTQILPSLQPGLSLRRYASKSIRSPLF